MKNKIYSKKLKKPVIGKRKREALYAAMHSTLVDLRIELKDKIDSKVDVAIAQVEHKMWKKILVALGINL